MAEQQQYPLPNPGLPLGQQAVSPVAQTNPVQSLYQGGVQGMTLGLAARQQAALEQERQTQLMSAQLAAQQAMAKQKIDLLGAAGTEYEKLKYAPKSQARFLKETYLPIANQVYGQFGIQTNPHELNPHDPEEKDYVDEFHQISKLVGTGELTPAQGAQKINDLAIEYSQTPDIASTLHASANSMETNAKHQDEMEQQFAQEISATKARSGGYGQQDQNVNKGIHLRKMAEQYYDPKTGNYNVPQAQYTEMVMGLANMLSPTGTADEDTRNKLESMTSKGKLNQAVQYLTGVPQTGNTQAVIKNLMDSIDRQGAVSQQLRDNYLSQIQPNQSLASERAQRQVEKGRGAAFTDYLPGGKNSSIKPQMPSFKSSAEAEKSNIPKGTIVLINGKKYRKD